MSIGKRFPYEQLGSSTSENNPTAGHESAEESCLEVLVLEAVCFQGNNSSFDK
jgi:hypothetical protein